MHVSAFLKNVETSRQLYKYLIRESRKLPGGAAKHYEHTIKQSFKQHIFEPDPARVKEIIAKALKDAEWIINKYKTTSTT